MIATIALVSSGGMIAPALSRSRINADEQIVALQNEHYDAANDNSSPVSPMQMTALRLGPRAEITTLPAKSAHGVSIRSAVDCTL